MLTNKAKRFDEELRKQIGKKTGISNEKAEYIRDGLRRQLPSNIFVQFLAGAPEARTGSVRTGAARDRLGRRLSLGRSC